MERSEFKRIKLVFYVLSQVIPETADTHFGRVQMLYRNSMVVVVMSVLPVMSVTGCGNIALQLLTGQSTSVQGLNPSADGASFAERCGAKASELGDPARVLLEQDMKSAPIVVSGVKSEVAVKITLQADIHIRATGGMSVTETRVKVVSLDAGDGGRFSKAEADNAAIDSSNRKTSWGMSSGLLLKLQKTDKAFENVLCSVSFTAKIEMKNNAGTGIVTFDPGIPMAVNPKSSVENLNNELGQSRSFTAEAKVLKQATGWAQEGTTATVTSTIKKLSGNFSSIPGMPTNAPAIKADLAYEVTITSPGREVSTLGLSKRQVFFINSETKSLVAALDESGRVSPLDNKPLPPALAIIGK